jgi:hypothetical protein
MSDLLRSYRSLPTGQKVVVGGLVLVAAVVVLVNVPGILSALAVAGLVLLAIAVLLAVVGVCALPFAGIGLAFYGLGKALRPNPPQAAGPPPRPAARRPLESPSELPSEIAAQVARVRDRAAALRSPDQVAFLSVEDQQHIDRTLNEYLPNCLATFQALPMGSADWPAEPGGETAGQLVTRQLRLLEESLERIGKTVFQAGAAQLVAQQRFLEERLRPDPRGDLDL